MKSSGIENLDNTAELPLALFLDFFIQDKKHQDRVAISFYKVVVGCSSISQDVQISAKNGWRNRIQFITRQRGCVL